MVMVLGYIAVAPAVKFMAKMAVRRLDTLMSVEGELRRDAMATTREEKKEVEVDAAAKPRPRPPCGAWTWARHLYRQDRSVRTFLRGGWAELGFVLATAAEESVIVLALLAVARCLPGDPSSFIAAHDGVGWARVHDLFPTVVAGLLSWPLRAVRTAVMVNYLADTTAPPRSREEETAEEEEQQPACDCQHRYNSAGEVWRRLRQTMGVRSLLLNGLDVDTGGRVLSKGLAWAVLQPVTRWFRQMAQARARVAGPSSSSLPSGAESFPSPPAPSLLVRPGHYRYFNLAALVVVVGVVNTLHRPFVVVRQRMALLPSNESTTATTTAAAVAADDGTAPSRRGCRYTSGWDCACHVVRREGVTALFAGLPLCLLTSTVVPLVMTFAGFTTEPFLAGTAV